MLSSTVWAIPISLSPPPLPLPSPPPPPQGSNQALPKQPSLVPAPLTIPSSPSIETSLNIPPKPQSFVLGGSKGSFHIDAKLFSFSFDGGRSDSYAIHETRWNVKSSIWVGTWTTTWAFKFKLTPALLALRVCKPGGGRRVVSYLGAKEISWTKNFSGGLEVSKQTGESSRGILCGEFESPKSAAVPDLVLSASTLNVDLVHGALVTSLSAILEGANPDVEISATVASVYELELDGCTSMEDSSASGANMVDSNASKVGSTPAITAMVSPTLQNGSQAHHRHYGADNYGGGSGVKDNCLLECNPLTRWDPNTLGEVVLVQDDAGGAQVAETEPISSWVSQLMKDFCNMVGFPIVKHEVQCLTLFRLLEQECLKVIDVGVPKQPPNSGHETSGGILLVWDKRVFEKMDVIVGQFSVSVLLRGVVDDFVWAYIGVYGPNDDGALVYLDWEEHFENISQWMLPRAISDHYPLLLEAGVVRRGRSAFKFENMWLQAEGFVDRVQQWWVGYSFTGSPSYILAQKLKTLKADLKKWNREVFGC
uniref:Uncharacterized protein n=1 Tax=Quercus lobata TaxID=97700 RepID=A0A7N2R375_QUELO